MKADLIQYYLEILKRFENIKEAKKEMTFNLLNIDDKETLIELQKMTDEELIDALM